jgi:prepilin-type N-terminal cleavage/methylation domain-containing protein
MAEPVKERGMAHTNRKQAGMTLVELMIAMVVLAVGMAGVLLMITSGIASNNRNRLDTGATNISQLVMEAIVSKPAGSNPIITLQDCRPAALGGPQNLQINTAGAAGPAGAGALITNPLAAATGTLIGPAKPRPPSPRSTACCTTPAERRAGKSPMKSG